MNRWFFLALLLGLCWFNPLLRAQAPDGTVRAYIEQYAALAIAEQIRTGYPAAIKLAQGIHESGAGKGSLALRSNNHFGLKCKTNWTGLTAYHDDDEKAECFRAYDSVQQSYRDHSDYLKNNKRYAALFYLEVTDYTGWANGLKAAGYATNPAYAKALIHLVETYQLNNYTLQAAAGTVSNAAFNSPLQSAADNTQTP